MKSARPTEVRTSAARHGAVIVTQAPRFPHLTAIDQPGPAASMTTREIAELTGKRHDNVMRDARVMLLELHGEGGVLSFEETYRDPQNGQTYPVLALPKRETLILVSGYSVTMRARIIDRWQELEAGAALCVPLTFAEALQLAAEQAFRIEHQQAALQQAQAVQAAQAAQIESARPAVEFVNDYAAAGGLTGLQELACIIKADVSQVKAFLLASKAIRVIGKRSLIPTHAWKGRYCTTVEVIVDGFTRRSIKFTPAGVLKIGAMWGQRAPAPAKHGQTADLFTGQGARP